MFRLNERVLEFVRVVEEKDLAMLDNQTALMYAPRFEDGTLVIGDIDSPGRDISRYIAVDTRYKCISSVGTDTLLNVDPFGNCDYRHLVHNILKCSGKLNITVDELQRAIGHNEAAIIRTKSMITMFPEILRRAELDDDVDSITINDGAISKKWIDGRVLVMPKSIFDSVFIVGAEMFNSLIPGTSNITYGDLVELGVCQSITKLVDCEFREFRDKDDMFESLRRDGFTVYDALVGFDESIYSRAFTVVKDGINYVVPVSIFGEQFVFSKGVNGCPTDHIYAYIDGRLVAIDFIKHGEILDSISVKSNKPGSITKIELSDISFAQSISRAVGPLGRFNTGNVMSVMSFTLDNLIVTSGYTHHALMQHGNQSAFNCPPAPPIHQTAVFRGYTGEPVTERNMEDRVKNSARIIAD